MTTQYPEQVVKLFVSTDHQSKKSSPETVLRVLKNLGVSIEDPSFKVIHVAGTSGKTSTSYHMSRLLGTSGKKVGLTVSPHTLDVRERVQIGSKLIPKAKFNKYLSEFIDSASNYRGKLIYFEFMVAFSLWVFKKEKVDYAVVEVGIGGLNDSTNIFSQNDKACVITDIGIDHTRLLGKTIKEIALQKAGIIKPGNAVFMNTQKPVATNEVTAYAKEQGAQMFLQDPLNTSDFQKRNFELAKATVEYLARRDSLVINEEDSRLPVAGRMQVKQVEAKQVIFDSAHNLQKLTALQDSIKSRYKNKKITTVISFKQGKDVEKMLSLLKDYDQIIFTEFPAQVDYGIKAHGSASLSDKAKKLGLNHTVVPDHEQALEEALESNNDLILVTGSLYLVSNTLELV